METTTLDLEVARLILGRFEVLFASLARRLRLLKLVLQLSNVGPLLLQLLDARNGKELIYGCQWVGVPGLGSGLSYRMVRETAVQSAHLCRSNDNPLRPRRVTWVKTEDVKSGRSGALNPDRLGLSCTGNKCSDTGLGTSVS